MRGHVSRLAPPLALELLGVSLGPSGEQGAPLAFSSCRTLEDPTTSPAAPLVSAYRGEPRPIPASTSRWGGWRRAQDGQHL